MHAEYAIQISAWPSLEEARKHQLELMEEGFDAYTQRYYLHKKDEVWYRVRVGNYFNKQKALKVKKQIESFTGITTWLDIVSTK
jgi:cell division septation protein DedD